MTKALLASLVLVATGSAVLGQTPQPFPRADLPTQEGLGRPAPQPPPAPAASRTVQPATPDPDAPSSEAVGFPIYPNAKFLASYDAGKGQRYYLFGSLTPYAEMVQYYQTRLRDRGAQVFDDPATHTFAQRFREETMVFPPGVTVKDWTSGGSAGYPHPDEAGRTERFPTVIMIVPPLPAVADGNR